MLPARHPRWEREAERHIFATANFFVQGGTNAVTVGGIFKTPGMTGSLGPSKKILSIL
jgi:hypothetical protein